MAYIPIPKIMKSYGKRLSKLNQKVLELRFYWEKRAVERDQVTRKVKELQLTIGRLQTLEKGLAELMQRKYFTIHASHKTAQGDQCYPLFLTQNDCNRLKQLLRRPRRLVHKIPGKHLFWLSQNEYVKVRKFFKQDWRFKITTKRRLKATKRRRRWVSRRSLEIQ